jgi:hypothetical protein
MIDAVLSEAPTFFMACIAWDKASIKAVDKHRRVFVWKNKEVVH